MSDNVLPLPPELPGRPGSVGRTRDESGDPHGDAPRTTTRARGRTTTIPGYLAGTWKADPAQTEIGFSLRQLMVSKVRGRFTRFDVTIVTSEDPHGSSVGATIELASIDTGNPKRDHHLVSTGTFFDVEKYPTMSYRSTGIRRSEDRWSVDGELTLHGITRPVPLAVEVNGFAPGPDGAQRAEFTATARIDRGAFGIDGWTGGGAVVSDKVRIDLKIHATLQTIAAGRWS